MKYKNMEINIFSNNTNKTMDINIPINIWLLEGNIDCFPGISLESNSSSYESFELMSIIIIY